MRYGPDHKASTRERVLKEAAAAIRADGPDRVGVAALMKRAGLTHGGFYAHWPSKDALLADAIDAMFDEGAAAYFVQVEATDPRAVLAFYVDRYVSLRHRDARDRGCPVPILAGEQHRLPALARERFAAAVTRMVARIAGLLARAGVDDAAGRAASAAAEMIGAVALSRVNDDAAAEELLAAARASVRAKLDLSAAPNPRPIAPRGLWSADGRPHRAVRRLVRRGKGQRAQRPQCGGARDRRYRGKAIGPDGPAQGARRRWVRVLYQSRGAQGG